MPKRESFMLVISLLLFTVLIVFRDIFLISMPGYVVSLFFVVSLLFLSYNDAIKAIFYLMPFTNGIPGYTVLFALIVLLLKTRKLNIGQILPAAFIAFLELANVSFFHIEARYTSVISYICFITLFFLILFNQDRRIDKKACVRYFCYGVSVALPIVYIPIIINYSFDTVISGEVRGSMIMGYENPEDALNHLAMNANTMAYYSIVLLAILLWGRKKLNFNKPLYYILVIISIITGACSFSRAWLLLVAVMILLYVINSRYRVIYILFIAIGLSFVFTTQNFVIQTISDVFASRMNAENIETGGLRTVIFSEYNEKWSADISNIIIGTGAVHSGEVLDIDVSMHSGLQQIWVSHGILGLLLYVLVFLYYLKHYCHRKTPIAQYMPFIFCFMFDQSIQFLVPYPLMLPFLPTLYLLSIPNDEPIQC